jgi:hypothetical protein
MQVMLLCGAVAMLLAGCLTTSVYPFYTSKDLLFDPALVGNWTKTTDPKEHWDFQQRGTNSYLLAYWDDSSTNSIQARMFKLEGQTFLDLFPASVHSEVMPPPIPSHFLLRVSQMSPTLRMAPLDCEWLAAYLEANPKALQHLIITNQEAMEEERLVLTGDTKELQRFVRKHLNTHDAWSNVFELQRH